MKKALATLLFLILVLSIPGQAGTKEELIRLQSDVLQLQNQIRLLQRGMDEHNGILKSLLEQLNDQVAASNHLMENLIRTVSSQKEDLQSVVGQIRKDLQELHVKLDDTQLRIASLHQKLEENQMRVETLRSAPGPSLPGAGIEPDQVYSAAYNDYLMHNYDLAIAGFQDFLANYSDSEYADNALYYLGVAYFEQGRYEQSIQAFDRLINLYPQADKAPPAFYKKALVLQQLQRNEEAIDTFKRLITLYQDSPEANLARQELERLGVEVPVAKGRRTR